MEVLPPEDHVRHTMYGKRRGVLREGEAQKRPSHHGERDAEDQPGLTDQIAADYG